jgi:ERCC4-type nuclease
VESISNRGLRGLLLNFRRRREKNSSNRQIRESSAGSLGPDALEDVLHHRATVDNRDPWPHPWAKFVPEGWELERGVLETGDFALSAIPGGALVERKTPTDMASCIGANRERFERELKRGRYVGRMIVVIEGTLADVCGASRGISHNAIIGTVAAWTLRYCPFVFCGSPQEAGNFAFRFLAPQVRDIERMAKALTKERAPHLPAPSPPARLLKSPWRASWRKSDRSQE